MTSYRKLWAQIEARIEAATAILRADSKGTAGHVEAAVADWLAHNELELALDALEDAADDDQLAVRPRFWEELLTAAMLMGLEPQLRRIAARFERPSPPFGIAVEPPHIRCDVNGFIERDVYRLDAVGAAHDFADLGRPPRAGEWVVLYDDEILTDGALGWLLADAQIVERDSWGLVAKAKRDSYRSVPR